MGRTNNFDVIRLFAAFEVAVVHMIVTLDLGPDPFALHVIPGVPVFFLISGYLVFNSYERTRSLRRYAVKRAARLYPALYVCFALCIVVLAAIGVLAAVPPARIAIWSVAQLTFVQFYNPDFLRGFGTGVLNGALWTIAVELQFYVLTPILAWVVRRLPWLWAPLIVGFAAANIAFTALADGSTMARFAMVSFGPWFYMFLIGAWLSTSPAIVAAIVRAPLWLVIGGYALLACLVGVTGGHVGTNSIGPAMFVALAILVMKVAYTAPSLAGWFLRGHDISYGLYIYHMPVFNLVLWAGFAGSLQWGLLGLSAAIGLAIASWFLVERPSTTAASFPRLSVSSRG